MTLGDAAIGVLSDSTRALQIDSVNKLLPIGAAACKLV